MAQFKRVREGKKGAVERKETLRDLAGAGR